MPSQPHRRSKTLLLLYIILMCLIRNSVLVRATSVNATIDDASSAFTYTPSGGWNTGGDCSGCTADPDASDMYDGTWHDSTFNEDSGSNDYPNVTMNATVSFTGTAVYVYVALALSSSDPTGNSDMTFYIDGAQAGTFYKAAPGTSGYEYKQCVFGVESLSSGTHTLLIQNGHVNGIKALILLDYVVYSYDDEESTSTTSTASSSTSTAVAVVQSTTSTEVVIITSAGTTSTSLEAVTTAVTQTSESPSSDSATTGGGSSAAAGTTATGTASSEQGTTSSGATGATGQSGSHTSTSGNANASGTGSPSVGASAGSSEASAGSAEGSKTSSHVGAIVGGVVGGCVAILALLLLFVCLRRRQRGSDVPPQLEYTPYWPVSEAQPYPLNNAQAGASQAVASTPSTPSNVQAGASQLLASATSGSSNAQPGASQPMMSAASTYPVVVGANYSQTMFSPVNPPGDRELHPLMLSDSSAPTTDSGASATASGPTSEASSDPAARLYAARGASYPANVKTTAAAAALAIPVVSDGPPAYSP
ncbi:hypothetical protein FISHEDRAFT_72540 [Fistulina hepatica ATCC 64428]|nr:hypothetical protein FISHEDRAFT_72540 [Fistulina hepatica ATCC 64428]